MPLREFTKSEKLADSLGTRGKGHLLKGLESIGAEQDTFFGGLVPQKFDVGGPKMALGQVDP